MGNSDLSARLKKVRKELGSLSQSAFAEGIGETRATIAGIETGRSNLTFPQLQSVLNIYNVNPVYLLSGHGEVFLQQEQYLSSPPSMEVNDPFTGYNIKGAELVTVEAQAGYSQEMQTPSSLPIVRIPGLQDENARVFEVAGESMDPILNHGDYIACRKVSNALEFRDGLLYIVVARNHGVSVKYVRKTVDAIRCSSHNSTNYPAFNIPLDEVLELWEVQIRITQNILNNLVENIPVRLNARFERIEKVMEHLLERQEDQR